MRARPRKRRGARPEDILEAAGILKGDSIAMRRRPHRLEQGRSRRLGDIVPRRGAESRRPRSPNGPKRRISVVAAKSRQQARDALAQIGALFPQGGVGQRRAEQDNAKIGVPPDARPGCVDRPENAFADAGAGRRERSRRCARAVDEVLRLHAVAGREHMHIAGFWRAQFGFAGRDEGLRERVWVDPRVSHARAMTPSPPKGRAASRSAIEKGVTRCKPLQPAMLFTSSTKSAPPSPSIISTPAKAAPSAATARNAISRSRGRGLAAIGFAPCPTLVIQ